MEQHEINILEVIHKYEDISQRDISSQTGISLGMVNMLLKKFIKVGLIKTERLNGNKIKYFLTPQGITLVTKKTLDFVVRSYQAVLKIQRHINDIISENYESKEIVYLFGNKGELSEILIDVLQSREQPYAWLISVNETEKFVHWNSDVKNGIFILSRLEV